MYFYFGGSPSDSKLLLRYIGAHILPKYQGTHFPYCVGIINPNIAHYQHPGKKGVKDEIIWFNNQVENDGPRVLISLNHPYKVS